MKPEQFLRRVLGESGFYCVFASRGNHRPQELYDSVDTVVARARERDAAGYDSYFALATFNDDSSRKASNVKQLRSFFLDLDCGPSKEYTDQHEAITALKVFCADTKIPKPLLINSGRGVHAYWPLSEPVSKEEWLPVAERFKGLCAKHGLKADPVVTADAARVLRVPHTHNHKDDPPTLVDYYGKGEHPPPIDFDEFKGYLGDDVIPVSTKHIPSGSNAVMAALLGNKKNIFKDILSKTQDGGGCAQLKRLVRCPKTIQSITYGIQ